jgi:hypothetical protein
MSKINIGNDWKTISNSHVMSGGIWRPVSSNAVYTGGSWKYSPSASPATYGQAVLDRNPLNYWRFGESSGSTIIDATGNLDGTYVNSPTLGVSGPSAVNDGNTCVYTNHENGYGSLGVDSSWSIPVTGTFLIECWVYLKEFDYTPSLKYHQIFSKWGPLADGWLFEVENRDYLTYPRPRMRMNDQTGSSITLQDDSNYINYDQWHYYVYLFNNKTLTMYIDGVARVSDSNSSMGGDIRNNTDPLYICRLYGSSRYLYGYLDEMAIYNYDWYTGLAHKDWWNYL